MSPALISLADKNSKGTVNVIIQSADGTDGARQALDKLGLNGGAKKGLDLVGAVVTSIKLSKIDDLAATDGLIVTPDATVATSGGPAWGSNQLWPYVAASANLWPSDRGPGYGKEAPTIAIVDSGVEKRSDFGKRLLASVDLGTRPDDSPGDGRGHGTFVAGIAPGYMQLSGTSFAAPVVAGAAADILARHPKFTPDDVKGALTLTARTMPGAGLAGGVGEITASAAAQVDDPPNPNAALEHFVKSGKGHISKGDAFNSASWVKSAKTSASWNSASWNSASWNSASWNSASWNSASWNSASWNSDSYEDAVDEGTSSGPYLLGPASLAALFADPLLAPDPSTLPAASS